VSSDIEKGPHELFSVFEYEDIVNQQTWLLYSNKSFKTPELIEGVSLFDQSLLTTYLIPEKKEIDYFLKFNPGNITCKNCLEILRKIPQISACYELDPSQLISKNNLIFG
jgi:hypothetical protein